MNLANFAGGWLETVKMSINSAKSWFAVDRSCNFALLTNYIYVKKDIMFSFSFFIIKDMLR